MKKTHRIICCFLLMVASHTNLWSQSKVEIQADSISVTKLIEILESKSNYKIYSGKLVLDTLFVTIALNDTPDKILKKALEKTNYKVSVYKDNIFLLQNRELLTRLPRWIPDPEAGDVSEIMDIETTDYSSTFQLGNQSNRKAMSELIVYDVGNATLKPTSKIKLSGVVTNGSTGERIPGMLVYIESLNVVTTTDSDGKYELSLLPDKYMLSISGSGMDATTRQVHLYSAGNLDIEVIEKMHTLSEVAVTAGRGDNIRQATLGVEYLKMKEIKNIPTAFGEADVISIIKSLPGVKSVGEMSSGFNVRGGATDQNLILFNDNMIYNPSHLFGLFSAFNPDVVEDLELYKSSIPAKYGGRISSVLDIGGRSGNNEKVKGIASIGLLTSRLALDGPIVRDKTTFLLGGRATYSDWLLNLLPEKSGYKDGRAGFYDMNMSLKQKIGLKDELTLNGYYSYDKFRFEQNEKYNYSNANGSLNWRHIFNQKLIGNLVLGHDHYDYETQNSTDPFLGYKMTFRINQMFAKTNFIWDFNDRHTFNWGVNSLMYNLKPGKNVPLGENSDIKEDKLQREKALETAVYIGDEWTITPQLTFDVGIRYSVFNVLGDRSYNLYNPDHLPSLATITEVKENQTGVIKTYQGAEYRIAARYAFSRDLSVKLGANTMRQYIHKISNTSIMSPTDTWKLSDVNIKPQSGVQYAGGIYKNFFDGEIETSIEGYYKTMKNYLDYRNAAKLLMNHNLETDVLRTIGRAYGAELMIKKTRGRLNGWVSYTYSRTELKQNDKRTIDPVNAGGWYAADFDKPHEFKFIGNYKFTHRYSMSLNTEYTTGRPITLPVGKYMHAGGEFIHYSERNAFRVPDYFRMDLAFNVEPHHRLVSLTHSMVSFGLYNVTGRKNAHSVYYKSDEKGKMKGYKLAIFGAPIPYVAYSLKF